MKLHGLVFTSPASSPSKKMQRHGVHAHRNRERSVANKRSCGIVKRIAQIVEATTRQSRHDLSPQMAEAVKSSCVRQDNHDCMVASSNRKTVSATLQISRCAFPWNISRMAGSRPSKNRPRNELPTLKESAARRVPRPSNVTHLPPGKIRRVAHSSKSEKILCQKPALCPFGRQVIAGSARPERAWSTPGSVCYV